MSQGMEVEQKAQSPYGTVAASIKLLTFEIGVDCSIQSPKFLFWVITASIFCDKFCCISSLEAAFAQVAGCCVWFGWSFWGEASQIIRDL